MTSYLQTLSQSYQVPDYQYSTEGSELMQYSTEMTYLVEHC